MTNRGEPGRVLVVDDNLHNRLVVQGHLEVAGHTVLLAEDGEQALSLFADGDVDLVLLDILMPGLDGYEVCRRIRGMPGGERVPVLMLTALDSQYAGEAEEAGADDFLRKPIDGLELRLRVRSSLRTRRAERAVARQAQELVRRSEGRERAANDLLRLIHQVQEAYIGGREPSEAFAEVLKPLLDLTASPRGFVGDVVEGDGPSRRLRVQAARAGPWFGESPPVDARGSFERPVGAGLLGLCVREGRAMMAGGGAEHAVPEHYDGVSSLLLLPLRKEGTVLGVLALANREGGYDDRVAAYLEPLASTCAGIIERHRAEERRRASERSLGEAEQKLLRAQKLEAVGKLAGGIAHDFNNLLLAITSYAEFVREELPPGSTGREDMDELLRASGRATSLTRQLLLFSRQQPIELAPVDLNEVIVGLRKLLERTLGEDVRVQIDVPSRPSVVLADVGQLDQLVLNLAVNARDAMPRGGVLSLEVRTEAASQGRTVVLRVRDTGVGMSPEVQRRVFEPFFTTKDPSKGTGLGLSTCYGLVGRFGGTIDVQSVVGEGSTFEIRLPAVRGRTTTRSTPPEGDDARGTETLLLVEDDPIVRKVVLRVLRRFGYSVRVAEDAHEAREVYRAHRDEIQLVFTDLVLPRGNGLDFARWVRADQPTMPILIATGYADARVDPEDGEFPVMWKPYAPAALAQRLRELLAPS
mgnify:CR=1 FL=1